MDTDQVELAIASEGSFGAHPALFFAAANEEVLLLTDRKNKVEFSARGAVYRHQLFIRMGHTEEELLRFAEKALFPSHGLLLRTSEIHTDHLLKGITSPEELLHHFGKLKQHGDRLLVQTDMRAHMNPTRMNNIRLVTEKLIQRLVTGCPDCGAPGFGPVCCNYRPAL